VGELADEDFEEILEVVDDEFTVKLLDSFETDEELKELATTTDELGLDKELLKILELVILELDLILKLATLELLRRLFKLKLEELETQFIIDD
jgi:hypothetical protein